MKFVIIGGDAAGMSAASRAKRRSSDLEVTVLEQTQDVSYSACGMPYNIADPDRDIYDLVVRRAQMFREKQGIDLRTGHRVEHIDRERKLVSGTNDEGEFELPYDALLIAAGASPVVPNLPGFDAPGVLTLKSLEDGARIKTFLADHSVERAVIVGMGYIALEMAEALRARGIGVDLIKPRPDLLPWLPRDLAQEVRGELEDNGVRLFGGYDIESIVEADSGLSVTSGDLALDADLVLVAIGVAPNSRLAADVGLELSVGRSIATDRYTQTSDESIYAAGDCADAYHVVTGEKTWIPLALRANRAGWATADNVLGGDTELQGVVGTAVFKVFDLEVARTGLTSDEAEGAGFAPAEVTIKSRSRAHGHPGSTTIWVSMVGDKRTGRLLGAQMVGREGTAHRINAAAIALHAAMTVSSFSGSDLSYAPPFGPVWDPLLTAANQLAKKL